MDEKTLHTLIKSLGDNTKIKNGITIKDISYNTLVSKGEDIVEPLTEYLDKNKGSNNGDINWEVANILLDICEVHGTKTPLKLFIEVSKGMNEFKNVAIRCLGFIDDKESYDTLISIIKNSSENLEYKINAISSLGDLSKYNEKEVLDRLNGLMDSIDYTGDPTNDKDVKSIKNNIIAAINRIINKDAYATIGEIIKRRREER